MNNLFSNAMRHLFSIGTMVMIICGSEHAVAAITFTSAISPGDLGPPTTTIPAPLREFFDYVNSCRTELGFDSIPQFDCQDIRFRGSDPRTFAGIGSFAATNDFVAHQTINNDVDALFACRWVGTDPDTGESNAATGEMLVHNRTNGKTCFFQLRDVSTSFTKRNGKVFEVRPFIQTTNPPSPTDALAINFWDSPSNVAKTNCTGCHSGGPYIASGPIVHALAQYGLINDGHDTFGTIYSAVGPFAPQFNDIIRLTRSDQSCASSCHVVGGIEPTPTFSHTISDIAGNIIIPSMEIVFKELLGAANDDFDQVPNAERMPPSDPYSEYRWVNLDKPWGAGGDWERLKDLKAKLPQFVCKKGVVEVQAHVVDSVRRMSTADFPDVLRTFNLLDGLVCNNADQTDGHSCGDYQTRYHCSSGWTKWRNTSAPDSTGEVESRDNFPGLCSAPMEIQARTIVAGSWQYGIGPPDRLREFDLNGVACVNSSQPSGQCNDYTVRFVCAQ